MNLIWIDTDVGANQESWWYQAVGWTAEHTDDLGNPPAGLCATADTAYVLVDPAFVAPWIVEWVCRRWVCFCVAATA